MIRRSITLTSLLVVFSLAMMGCKKKTVADQQPTEQMQPAGLLEPATEPAEGEIREAMLALQRVHFGFDSADLNDDSRNALTEAAQKLADKVAVHLYVEGHADKAGETEYNLTLGEKRAKAVSNYLEKLGVTGDRLHIVSYGEEKPLTDGGGRAEMAKNRRVDFKLMRGEIELTLEDSKTIE